MSFPFLLGRRSALVFAVVALAACASTTKEVVAPLRSPTGPLHDLITPTNPVISQIYGGGGNSGSTFKNDFIELFNPTTSPVSLAGWSVQYASANGVFSQKTNLTGTIAPGGYFLIQEAKGTGGTTDLPTPDVTTTTTTAIAMSATGARVVLTNTQTLFNVACPTGASVINLVQYGTSNADCGIPAPGLSNTTAALRRNAGCLSTNGPTSDFDTGAPAPRNTASPTVTCSNGDVVAGPLDHVAMSGITTIPASGTTQFKATPQDIANITVKTATVTWSSSDPTVATVDAAGNVTGVKESATPVAITATATNNGITKQGSLNVTVVKPVIGFIDFSSSGTDFPPGFQTQLFATARVSNGGIVIPANFTFEATDDPAIVSILPVQNTAIVTGVSPGRSHIKITATPIIGGDPDVFTTTSINIVVPVTAPASTYAPALNDEFGDPTAANGANPNDFLIARTQYTLSYNQSRGTPNWVSYELDARQIVAGQDRCNCFTADPLLPAATQIFTSDYTSGGFDRGHMTRSFDRTAANVDNASTFYLTNVVPQTADLNEGVWAQFENTLGDSALAGRAVYIMTGPIFSPTHPLAFLKNEGKVAIPDSTWKIAIIGPDPGGVPFTHATIHTVADMTGITVLAVNMPNIAGIHDDPWQKYLTTIGKIEKSTGFNFLSVLDEAVQCKVEVRDCLAIPHLVSASGSSTVASGAPFTLNISSSDADGTTDGPWKLNVQWGDGSTPYNAALYALPNDTRPFARAHTFVGAPGTTYTITVTITDKKGGVGTSTFVVTIGS